MIFVIMGKSATGKDTIFRRLLKDKELNIKEIVPYTTRPVRIGEKEGREYHFVNEEEMNKLQTAGRIVEHRQYNTVHGIWHYFTVDDNDDVKSINARYAMIATLEAYVQLCEYYGRDCIVPIYIEVEDFERLKRGIRREKHQQSPSCEEVCRRFIADEHDFSPEKLKAASIKSSFVNDEIKACLASIKATIKNY